MGTSEEYTTKTMRYNNKRYFLDGYSFNAIKFCLDFNKYSPIMGGRTPKLGGF